MTPPDTRRYTVAVRALCEFTAKVGDLDLRFTPAPTALEGIEGHALVASRRGPAYEREVPLSGEWGPLTVRGRADGWDPVAGRLEEIKTHRGSLDRQPANHRALHWAQVRVYGWLQCQAASLERICLALVYLDVGTRQETVLTEIRSAAELQAHFEQQGAAFLAWAVQEMAHRTARDTALATLPFPHADFRTGQRPLAEAVFKAARSGRCLLAQAPTGIGKTVGTLYPLLRAMPSDGLDRVFFLTAKTSGRALALHAMATLTRTPATNTSRAPHEVIPIRTLELVARDKACEYPDNACHGESCPLAKGFYDRLPIARQAALLLPDWQRESVRALAVQQAVCPYYLTQELARWADVVVGDYNHFYDQSALLHGLTTAQQWRVAVLVDEAHNLVSRARSMYSAELSSDRLRALRRLVPKAVKKPLDKLQRRWTALNNSVEADYQVLDELPADLLGALQDAIAAVTEFLADDPTAVEPALQDFWFEALQFNRLAETFGAHSLADLTRDEGPTRSASLRLNIRNVVPAGFIAPRLAHAHCTVLFSATLQPWDFHETLLGLPDTSARLDVASPFTAEQLQVHITHDLSTRYQHRARAVPAIAERIARQYEALPGHYLAFFSSYDFLQQVHAAVASEHPNLPIWAQQRGMSEAAQAHFLARFTPGGRGIGFAVLGGSFSEGIDLPGERLIGAFVATLGMPQINPVNEQMRARLDKLLGCGFDYTYLYPGLQKVVQAAGRVIRTPQDRGVVYLLDDRYGRPDVQALLPSWWQL